MINLASIVFNNLSFIKELKKKFINDHMFDEDNDIDFDNIDNIDEISFDNEIWKDFDLENKNLEFNQINEFSLLNNKLKEIQNSNNEFFNLLINQIVDKNAFESLLIE